MIPGKWVECGWDVGGIGAPRLRHLPGSGACSARSDGSPHGLKRPVRPEVGVQAP